MKIWCRAIKKSRQRTAPLLCFLYSEHHSVRASFIPRESGMRDRQKEKLGSCEPLYEGKHNKDKKKCTNATAAMAELRRRRQTKTAASNTTGERVATNDFAALTLPFPWRLWQLLEDSETDGFQTSTVSWLPNGEGFTIFKSVEFTNTIMKNYFPQCTGYAAFTQEVCEKTLFGLHGVLMVPLLQSVNCLGCYSRNVANSNSTSYRFAAGKIRIYKKFLNRW